MSHIDPPRYPQLTTPLEEGMKKKFEYTLLKTIKDISTTLDDSYRDNKKSSKRDR